MHLHLLTPSDCFQLQFRKLLSQTDFPNVRYNDDHRGYVTRFEIDDEYSRQYEVHTVGAGYHQELWIPAEELETFNRHIMGKIQVIGEFAAEKTDKCGV